jgi:hypothetical protein
MAGKLLMPWGGGRIRACNLQRRGWSQTNSGRWHTIKCADSLLRRLCSLARSKSLTTTEADLKAAAHAGRGGPYLRSSRDGPVG